MKEFDEIAKMVFSKDNKGTHLEEFESIEIDAYRELSEIKERFGKAAISKEQATAEKMALKEEYNACLIHSHILSDISNFITTGIWNAADTVEFATFIATGLTELCDKASKHKDLSLYNGFIVQICNYLEGKMKEVSQ